MDFLASLSGGDCWSGLERRAQTLRLQINGAAGLLVDGMVCFCKKHTTQHIYERVDAQPILAARLGGKHDLVIARSVFARRDGAGAVGSEQQQLFFTEFQRVQSLSVGAARAVAVGGWQAAYYPGSSVTVLPVAVLDAFQVAYSLAPLSEELQHHFLHALLHQENAKHGPIGGQNNARAVRLLERVAAQYHGLKCERRNAVAALRAQTFSKSASAAATHTTAHTTAAPEQSDVIDFDISMFI